MKFWLYTEHIFVDVLNQNDRRDDFKAIFLFYYSKALGK